MAKNNLKQIICNFAIQIKHKQIMRKFYTAIAIVAMAFTAQAQTALNVNGSLEDWTDGMTEPEGWFINENLLANGKISKFEEDAQDGVVSLRIESQDVDASGSNNNAGLQDIAVTAGETYTVRFWYKSDDESLRFKNWFQWRTEVGGGTNIVENVTTFQPADDLLPVTEWTEVVVTEVAPENAQAIRINFRNYKNSTGVLIDNVVLHVGEPTSTQKNNIEGLSIYPNPASDMVNVVSNSLSNKDITITDLLGKTVLTDNVNQSVNISSLKSGVYMMQITQDGKSATRKLIVK